MSSVPTAAFPDARRRLALVVILALFGVAVLIGYSAIDRYRDGHRAVRELARATESIRYGDEVLTMSARMAAFTGDPEWQARYDAHVPLLDAAIALALQRFPAGRTAIEQTSAANQRLIAFEARAFELAAAGKLKEARGIMLGPAYELDKALYQAGLTRLGNDIERHRIDLEARVEREFTQALAIAVAIFIAIMLALLHGTRQIGQRLAIEKAIGGIGQRLLKPDASNLDDVIDDALRELATWSGADAAYLLRRIHALPGQAATAWRLTHAYPKSLHDRADLATCLALSGSPAADGAVDVRPRSTLAAMTGQRPTPLTDLDFGRLLGHQLQRTGDSDYCLGIAARSRTTWGTAELPLLAMLADIITNAIAMNERAAELQHLATVDALTGIANRRHFSDAIARESARIRRTRSSAALLLIDLDHFKKINDHFGHATGDAVLTRFSARIARQLRDIDVFGRIGGEEFAILLPDTGRDEAMVAAERLRSAAARADTDAPELPPVTVSIGVAMFDEHDADHESAFRRADEALYIAKRDGRDRVRFGPAEA